MNITNKPNRALAIGSPALIIVASIILSFTAVYKSNPTLISNAILGDLVITAPLVYFLLTRKTSVSKLSVIRVMMIGLLVAGLILNDPSNIYIHFLKYWVSPILESLIIFFVGRKFYVANRLAKNSGDLNADFLSYSRMVLFNVTGNRNAGNLLASEIAVFYYAFFGRKDRGINDQSRFSSYKENGIILILYTILGLFLVEMAGMHFLLFNWDHRIAWVITILSLYTCLQLFAHIRAVKARPVIIYNGSLEVRSGLAGDASIRFQNIEKFEFTKKLPTDKRAVRLSLLKTLEGHNCIIYLKQPIEVTKFFGIRKNTRTVLFSVDNPKDFSASLGLKLAMITA